MSEQNPHNKVKEYTINAAWAAVGTDLDLVDEGGEMPRAIYVVTAGTGKIKLVCGDGSEAEITTLADGQYVHPTPFFFTTIVADADTDCTLIRVGW